MNDGAKPTTSPDVYHQTGRNCPRCNSPLKAKCTASVSKIIHIKCVKCAFIMDVESIRRFLKTIARAETPETAPSGEGEPNP